LRFESEYFEYETHELKEGEKYRLLITMGNSESEIEIKVMEI